MKPVKLTSPRVWRTYQGGKLIDAIHGIDGKDTLFPEEWIMSTVVARNAGREHIPDEGMCYLEDGTSFLKFISKSPRAALSQQHLRKWGITTGVLVKIIDAGERLTIQAHPDKETAMRLFGSPFGKTECWHILGGRTVDGEKPCIYLGVREGITREYWEDVFHRQDIPAMLSCLHKFPVNPGETYLIRGGVPHAIGAGCLLIEIQEPTDYTVRTERITPNGLHIADSMCHQGLGFEKMFDCFHYEGVSQERAYKNWCIPPQLLEETPVYTRKELVGHSQTDCFRLERYDITGSCTIESDGIFSGIYVFSGSGTLNGRPFSPGDQFFLGAACESCLVQASTPVTLFRCFGPK